MLLLRTWQDDYKDLNLDSFLLRGLTKEIFKFFEDLYNLEDLVFPQSVWPEEDTVGEPELVFFLN